MKYSDGRERRGERPIILTLQLDEASMAFFSKQRTTYFPPHLNIVPAHLTLFHNLPERELPSILNKVGGACSAIPPFSVFIDGLRKLGRGVAYQASGNALNRLRAHLAEEFKDWLIRQDKEAFRPHITIQNKASTTQATELYHHLMETFETFTVHAEGVQLWFYENYGATRGRWSPIGAVAFSGRDVEGSNH